MDAFGTKGIYRFIKVYASRGVKLANLVNLVAENLTERFKSLCFESSKILGKKGYQEALNFFETAQNCETDEYKIMKIIYENHSASLETLKELGKQTENHTVIQFFDTLYQCYK